MIKKFFILLFILLLFSCIDIKNKNHKLIKEIKSLNIDNVEVTNLLKKNNIKNPNNLILYDSNYYYLLSKLFYIKKINEKYNTWFNYFIENSIKIDNIFKDDALKLYITHLAKTNKWKLIKKLIIENQKILVDNQDEIYLKYAANESLNEINYIPEKIEILPILYQIITSNPSVLNNTVNQVKIEDYLIDSKIFYNYIYKYESDENSEDIDFNLNYLIKIIDNINNNYFLTCIINYIQKDKDNFKKNLENFFKNNNQFSYKKINILKKLSINLETRKNFYKLLSIYYKQNKYRSYLFC